MVAHRSEVVVASHEDGGKAHTGEAEGRETRESTHEGVWREESIVIFVEGSRHDSE
jgi:hypothetical protein